MKKENENLTEQINHLKKNVENLEEEVKTLKTKNGVIEKQKSEYESLKTRLVSTQNILKTQQEKIGILQAKLESEIASKQNDIALADLYEKLTFYQSAISKMIQYAVIYNSKKQNPDLYNAPDVDTAYNIMFNLIEEVDEAFKLLKPLDPENERNRVDNNLQERIEKINKQIQDGIRTKKYIITFFKEYSKKTGAKPFPQVNNMEDLSVLQLIRLFTVYIENIAIDIEKEAKASKEFFYQEEKINELEKEKKELLKEGQEVIDQIGKEVEEKEEIIAALQEKIKTLEKQNKERLEQAEEVSNLSFTQHEQEKSKKPLVSEKTEKLDHASPGKDIFSLMAACTLGVSFTKFVELCFKCKNSSLSSKQYFKENKKDTALMVACSLAFVGSAFYIALLS